MPSVSLPAPSGQAAALFIVVVVILSAIAVNTYALYAQLSISFNVKYLDQSISLVSYRTDHLTLATASSIKKDTIFLYSASQENYGAYDLTVQVFYGSQQIMPNMTWTNIPTGVYQVTVVPGFRFEQPNQFYSLTVTAYFPSYAKSVFFTITMPPS
jgi:hypothetical protein